MKAIILGAGQGKRLLPLTASQPKCLLPVAGRPALQWQLEALAANGIVEAVVVTGFEAATVESFVSRHPVHGIRVRTLHNPFFAVSDNLASLYVARHELNGRVLILNGDTLFEPSVLARASDDMASAITITIDQKAAYDSDDMKVAMENGRVVRIGKTLEAGSVNGEAIGMQLVNPEGAHLLSRSIEEMIRAENGLRLWYLSAIDRLARLGIVGATSVKGLTWCEIDSPEDLTHAEGLAERLARPLVRPVRAALAG